MMINAMFQHHEILLYIFVLEHQVPYKLIQPVSHELFLLLHFTMPHFICVALETSHQSSHSKETKKMTYKIGQDVYPSQELHPEDHSVANRHRRLVTSSLMIWRLLVVKANVQDPPEDVVIFHMTSASYTVKMGSDHGPEEGVAVVTIIKGVAVTSLCQNPSQNVLTQWIRSSSINTAEIVIPMIVLADSGRAIWNLKGIVDIWVSCELLK